MVKPPKISINDDESNALLSAKLETIQVDANKLFLDAYIDVVSKASINHNAQISSIVENFNSSLKGTCVALEHLPLLGTFSVSADEWYAEALQEF